MRARRIIAPPPVNDLNYVLEHMDLHNKELGIEKVRKCICAVRTMKIWVTFCGIAPFV